MAVGRCFGAGWGGPWDRAGAGRTVSGVLRGHQEERLHDQKEEFFHGYSLISADREVMRRGRDLVKMIWGVPELVKADEMEAS